MKDNRNKYHNAWYEDVCGGYRYRIKRTMRKFERAFNRLI